jgi:peptidyl-prolyl cis-trans isomerase SurA
MKRILMSLAVLSLGLNLTAQEDKVLMTIDGQPVMASEFLYIYEKNNQESALEQKNMDEYLDLFINFKLKVHEAEANGIDTTEAFKKELSGYRAQATPKYMKDEAAIDSLVEMSYRRIAEDRRGAHIAIQCPMTADDSTVEAALAQINTIRERVTTGVEKKVKVKGKWKKVREPEDFFAVAVETSSDPSVQENKGELGWITPFRYVYPFENAVYTTEVGEVTPVFRTAYGFHIALVEERRDHEEVAAAHIMKMTPRGDEEAEAAAKVAIDSLYELVKNGANFAEVAKAQSDDKGSAMRGGDLGWFGRGYMVKPFEEAAFALKDSGEISAPIKSDFGWHIIMLKGKRGIQPLEEMRESILKKVQRDERIKEADASFIRKARAEYNLPAEMSDEDVRAYADSHLEDKYPELKNLVKEYHDGILLFDISLEQVWDKASQDKEGLEAYFQAHKADYPWTEPRFKGFVVQCKNANLEKAVRAIIRNADRDSVESYINSRINIGDSITYVKCTRGLWTLGQNKIVDKLGFKQKKVEFKTNSEFPHVFVVGKKLKAPEEFADERGKVTSDYQDYLEAEWVKQLREKYPVVVDEAVFESLKK